MDTRDKERHVFGLGILEMMLGTAVLLIIATVIIRTIGQAMGSALHGSGDAGRDLAAIEARTARLEESLVRHEREALPARRGSGVHDQGAARAEVVGRLRSGRAEEFAQPDHQRLRRLGGCQVMRSPSTVGKVASGVHTSTTLRSMSTSQSVPTPRDW